MAGHEGEVRLALEEPDEVRRSRQDATVYLFYRVESAGRGVCAVVKQLDQDGFLITAYPTDAIKAGELVWSR